MSRVIDERVVQMRFDNKDFESNVKTSMSTLERLKNSLNLLGSSRSLDDIGQAAKKVSFSTMEAGITSVTQKFSAMEVIAISALNNITNSAMNAGKQLVSSLTVDQVSSGWDKYNQKVEGVQTIIAATGKSMNEVDAALEKLIWYSDETSYSFTDMVNNVGKFTSAGVELNDAVTAMEGIANWAASAGVNAQNATRAYYNLSQAMGTGALKVQDWASIENLNMSTAKFKQNAIDVAVELGKLQKTAEGVFTTLDGKVEVSATNFRDGLSKGWFDKEVMMKVFKDYAAYTDAVYEISDAYDTCSEAMQHVSEVGMETSAQGFKMAQEAKTLTDAIDATKDAVSSQWLKTFELIFGNYEQSKKLWTQLSNELWDVFAGPLEKRNDVLEAALTSPFQKLEDKIQDAGGSVEEFEEKVLKFAHANDLTSQATHALYAIADGTMTLEEAVQSGAISIETLKLAVSELYTTAEHDFSKITETLHFGDVSDDVKEVQSALQDLDYDLEQFGADGIFGDETMAAIKAFQEAEGLTIDGIVGPETLAALQKACDEGRELIEIEDEMIENANKLGGKQLLDESFWNFFHGIVGMIDVIKNAWATVFPPMDETGLYHIIEVIHGISEAFVLSEEKSKKLQTAFEGLFGILEMITRMINSGLNIGIRLMKDLFNSLGIDVFDLAENMGKALIAFREWMYENKYIEQAEAAVERAIRGTVATVKAWIKAFLDLPAVTDTINDFKMAFQDFHLGEFIEHLKGLQEQFQIFVNHLKQLDGFSLENLRKALEYFKQDIIDYFFDFEGFDGFEKAFTNLYNRIKDALEGRGITVENIQKKIADMINYVQDAFDKFDITRVLEVIKQKLAGFRQELSGVFGEVELPFKELRENIGGVVDTIGDKLEKFHPEAFIAVFLTGGLLASIIKFARGLKSVLQPIASFKEVITGMFRDFNKSFKIGQQAKMLESFGKTILMLAAAIGILAVVSNYGDLGAAVSALIGLSVALGILAGVLMVVNKAVGGAAEVADALQGLAVAIGVMVAALILLNLSGTSWDSVGMLTVIIAELCGAMFLLEKFGPKTQSGAKWLFSFAIAIGILGLVLAGISKIKNMGKALGGMAAIMIGLAIFADTMGTIHIDDGVGKNLLSLVAAVGLMAFVIRMITKIDMGEVMGNIGAFILVFGLIGVLMLEMKIAGEHAKDAGVGLLAVSASIILLVVAIKMMKNLDGDAIFNAMIVFGGLIVVFGLLAIVSRLAKDQANGVGKSMLAFAASMVVMSIAIAILANLPTEGVWTAVAAIDAIGLMFAAVLVASGVAKDSMKEIVAITVAITVLATALVLLSILPDMGSLIAATVALGVVMAAFAGSLVVIGKFGSLSSQAMASIGIMALVVGGLTAVLMLLSGIPVDNLMGAAISIGGLLLALSVSIGILAAVGPAAAAALPALAVVAGIIAGIAVLGGILGALPFSDAIIESLDKGAIIFGKIGALIGSFVGGIVGGFEAAQMESMLNVADSLSNFLTKMGPFFEQTSSDSFDLDGAIATTKALSEFMESLKTLATTEVSEDSLTNSVTVMESVAQQIIDFDAKIKAAEVDPEKITALMDAIGLIIDASHKIEGKGGIAQGVFGTKDLGDFAGQLTQFATSMSKVSTTLGNTPFTEETGSKITSMMESVGQIIEASHQIEAKGGFKQKLFGTKDMGDFGTQISTFAGEFKKFSTNKAITGFDETISGQITAVMDAVSMIIEKSSEMPAMDGVAQWWSGKTDLATFGEKLIPFADGLRAFNDAIGESKDQKALDTTLITNAMTAAGEIITAMNSIDIEENGFFEKSDMKIFADNLEPLGDGIAAFSKAVSDVSSDAITKAENTSAVIQTLSTTFAQDTFATTDLSTIAFGLETLGSSFSTFFADLKGIDTEGLETFPQVVSDLVSSLDLIGSNQEFVSAWQSIGETGVSGFLKGVANNTKNVTSAANQLVADFISALQTNQESMNEAWQGMVDGMASSANINQAQEEPSKDGKDFMSDFTSGMKQAAAGITASNNPMQDVLRVMTSSVKGKVADFTKCGLELVSALTNGINSKSGMPRNAFMNIINSAASGVRTYAGTFQSAGGHLASGLAQGIAAGRSRVIQAAIDIMRAAKEAAEREAKINSPSKVWAQMGNYLALGLAKGIDRGTHSAVESSTGIIDSVTGAISDAIYYASSIMEDNLEYQPTIRPVVDITGVQSGVNQIDDLMTMKKNIGVSMQAESIKGVVPVNQNATSNQDVISAINRLGASLGRTQGDVYNINGITYDDGSNISSAVRSLIRAAKVERRV